MVKRFHIQNKLGLLAAFALVLATLACNVPTPLTPTQKFSTATVQPAISPCSPGIDSPTIPAAQSTPEPGLVLRGCVRLGDLTNGSGLEGVSIYRSFASYDAVLVATTDASGYYQSDYQFIPGDEMVGVYAQKDGYTFEPSNVTWRHYYGYEVHTLDFVAVPK